MPKKGKKLRQGVPQASVMLSARFKEAEAEALRAAARQAGYSGRRDFSAWLRRQLLGSIRYRQAGDGRRPTLGRPPAEPPADP